MHIKIWWKMLLIAKLRYNSVFDNFYNKTLQTNITNIKKV